jgi:hypothetical protein
MAHTMPRVGFEPMILALERAKTVHALDHAAIMNGFILLSVQNIVFLNLQILCLEVVEGDISGIVHSPTFLKEEPLRE